MQDCSQSVTPIVKGDFLINNFEWELMKNILYTSAIGSLMYPQVCTVPDLTLHLELEF